MNKKILLILAAIIPFGAIFAFTNPTQTPPNGNTPAPINVSDIKRTEKRTEDGDLEVQLEVQKKIITKEDVRIEKNSTLGGYISVLGKTFLEGNVYLGNISGENSYTSLSPTQKEALKKLEINGPNTSSTNYNGLRLNNPFNGWGSSLIFGVGNSGGYDSARIYSQNESTGGMLKFQTAGQDKILSDKITINSNGNVGIGNPNPAAKLDVNGNIKAGDEYYNVLKVDKRNRTTGGITIKTNIPFANSADMTSINIEGYAYGNRKTIGLNISTYYYNNSFWNYTASSYGDWAPTIKLANQNGKVVIHLDDGTDAYFYNFKVNAFSAFGKDYYTGWTSEDGPLSSSSSKIVTVPIKNNFGEIAVNGNINFTGDLYKNGEIFSASSTNLSSSEPETPSAGDTFYDTTNNEYKIYNNNSWNTVGSASLFKVGTSILSKWSGRGSNGTSEGTESDRKNHFLGYQSGNLNEIGEGNTANGYQSLYENKIGEYNTANGFYSLHKNESGVGNTASGSYALYSNKTGGDNTAIGYTSLYYNTKWFNTAIGYNSGTFINSGGKNQTSTNSVYLGYDTRASADGNTNEIVIGHNARGNGSNSVTLGNSAITKTILKGNILTTRDLVVRSGSSGGNGARLLVDAQASTAHRLAEFKNNSGTHLILNGDGKVGIGTSSPTAKLTVNGNVLATKIEYTSDKRLKKNIESIENPLEKLLALRGVNFDWKKDDKKDIGFIAQEVEEVLPEIVSDHGEYKSVQYGNITALLVEAMKEQQSQIEELKREIEELKK